MSQPSYMIPGSVAGNATAKPADEPASEPAAPAARTVAEVLAQSHVEEVLDEFDSDLVGLAPIKQRIRDIAALLVIDKLRLNLGLVAQAPSLHMSFTGNPGTGKTTVALRMAHILHRLGYVRKGHLVAVTRDDLVGQYIGHTAPKTREILKKAMGGVLFIDEAYYLYRPENERDYGQEAIEILLQVMENQRDDLVVILAGYRDRMETFFQSNPGLNSRVAHHLDFPDYSEDELLANPRAALVFHWDHRHRQVRAEGLVAPLSDAENDVYFRTRPWQSRLGAWASQQSQPVESRMALKKAVAAAALKFRIAWHGPGSDEPAGLSVEIPRPAHWGGFRLTIQALELWCEGDFRIHDRARWTRTDTSASGTPAWSVTRLQP